MHLAVAQKDVSRFVMPAVKFPLGEGSEGLRARGVRVSLG